MLHVNLRSGISHTRSTKNGKFENEAAYLKKCIAILSQNFTSAYFMLDVGQIRHHKIDAFFQNDRISSQPLMVLIINKSTLEDDVTGLHRG